MANIRNANTWYIDTQGSALEIKNIKVTHVLVTCTATPASLILQDVTTAANKIRIDIEADETTQIFEFRDNPAVFPNGINPSTLTNCVATCFLQETRGG